MLPKPESSILKSKSIYHAENLYLHAASYLMSVEKI